MKKQLFDEAMSLADRRQALQDTCDGTVTDTYQKPLSEDEILIKKEMVTERLQELTRLNTELKAISAEYKAKMKPLSEEMYDNLNSVKNRAEEVQGTLYMIADHDDGMMGYYDENGELVQTRKLRPDEKRTMTMNVFRANDERLSGTGTE